MSNTKIVNAALLKAEIKRRGRAIHTPVDADVLPIEKWNEQMLLAALAAHLKAPNAAHLRDDLGSLGIGGRFTCGGDEWIVTDIGTRTLTAIKIDEKAKADPSWLQGPVYALAETSFDEEDVKAIDLA
ncbi:hypothetical protein OIU34_20520 [Pararhizobium sp. BT-229]|uniref:hypothetical protein n=1 Tax=Pararhizobium sp. BT-229 TaxID=2986923 RepID=UPI0021F793B2|nr:hypothetical protein [Pararhizobium sp. BT-229]MCV9964274.1 hypothetical protein [Pararhizobium sp. BT-229]